MARVPVPASRGPGRARTPRGGAASRSEEKLASESGTVLASGKFMLKLMGTRTPSRSKPEVTPLENLIIRNLTRRTPSLRVAGILNLPTRPGGQAQPEPEAQAQSLALAALLRRLRLAEAMAWPT
jgi:hypothetical protein